MAPKGNTQFKSLSGTQKAAILMMLFGEETAAKIMRNLTPREVQHMGAAMYSVRGVDQDTVALVLEDFFETLRLQTGLGFGAAGYVRSVLSFAFGDDKAQTVLSRIGQANTERPLEILDWMDAPSIAELLADEHPQIMALTIACLDYALAAQVLQLLPDTAQAEVVRRIATLNTVQPEALRDLEMVMQRKFKDSTTSRASQIGGVKASARIMNFAKQDMEQRVLKDIRKDDKDLMQAIQDNMFVFDNLIKSDDRSIQTLLRSVEPEVLVIALKGADEMLREKLLRCMSTRAAANTRDEMEALGPVRLTDVQEAQKSIIAIARRLSEEGTIVLAGRGGEQMV